MAGMEVVALAWGGSSAAYRDEEFDVVNDDGLGVVDVNDLWDRDDD